MSLARVDPSAVARIWRAAGAARWGLSEGALAESLEASVARAFAGREPSTRDIDRYLSALHGEDLALACACALGHEGAWDYFVREYRPLLYRTADALAPGGAARELADSLYADLYGLREANGERRSLFRYFHGRSSLATWLRAVLSQRHVDQVRQWRRTEPLPDDREVAADPDPPPDPDRPRLARLVQDALAAAIARLPARDRLRLRSYYVSELTLAQIGKVTGEHEATVSRQLARTRRTLRDDVTRALREGAGLDPPAIERGFELVLEDPAGLDAEVLMGPAERKNSRLHRSRYEGDG